MAGKYGSGSVVFLVAGYNLLAAKVKNLSHKWAQITEPTGGCGDDHEEHTPVGMGSLTLAQGGALFDTTALSNHAALSAGPGTTPQATPRVVCVGFAGNTLAAPFSGIQGMFQQTYEVVGQPGTLTKANAEYFAAGVIERGVILQPLAAKTVDWNTKTLGQSVDNTLDTQQLVIPIASATKANPCVVTTSVPHNLTNGQLVYIAGNSLTGTVINGERTATVIDATSFSVGVNTSGSAGAGTGGTVVESNSPNGAVGYLQVTAFSGFSQAVIKIRDSADDTTYADLIQFSTVTTAPTAERATVAGTVDRYACVDGDVTGSGSITVFVGLCRNA